MFLFPEVSRIYDAMPIRYQQSGVSVGNAVASYFLEERKVASVPGSVYGSQGDCHVRLVLCSSSEVFHLALSRLQPR